MARSRRTLNPLEGLGAKPLPTPVDYEVLRAGFVGPEEAAKILGVDRSTIYRKMDAGELRYLSMAEEGKSGARRISLKVLWDYIESHSKGGTA